MRDALTAENEATESESDSTAWNESETMEVDSSVWDSVDSDAKANFPIFTSSS